jgi:hypothetical protein
MSTVCKPSLLGVYSLSVADMTPATLSPVFKGILQSRYWGHFKSTMKLGAVYTWVFQTSGLILRKKVLQSFETLGITYSVTRCHNLGALNTSINPDCFENLKPHTAYSREIYAFTYQATYWSLTTRLHIGTCQPGYTLVPTHPYYILAPI